MKEKIVEEYRPGYISTKNDDRYPDSSKYEKFKYTIYVDGVQVAVVTAKCWATIFMEAIFDYECMNPNTIVSITREKVEEYDTN